MFSQVRQDSLSANTIFAPNIFNDNFSVEESWEIHKAAYIKQLKSQGLTEDEIKKSMVAYEKDKEEFITRVKEQRRLAKIQRQKAAEQRALAAIVRKEADEIRKQADILRKNADEIRKQADIVRKEAEEQRGKNTILREKAEELRKQANIERAKADQQRKLADIQRAKAEEQEKKTRKSRKNTENILVKNISLTSQSEIQNPITFKVNYKTTLYIGIRAHISSGNALIQIYNPKGIKQGELSLSFKSKSNKNKDSGELEYTSGSLDKTILGSEVGDWQIKFSSQKSEGTIAMSVAKRLKQAIDE